MQVVQNTHPVVAQSMASSFSSPSIDTFVYRRSSVQAVWTGTPTGTLKLQLSDDPTATAWTDFSGSATAVSGAADSFEWSFDNAVSFVRVVYTATSGAGTLDVYATQKE
jgi:hypothetical protein